MLIAVTRPVSPALVRCELTHLTRSPIDVPRAIAQHAAYEDLLRSLGATIARVDAAPDLPDAVFVEDTAVVLDEVAVVTRPGAPSRRAEPAGVAAVLARYGLVRTMSAPATLDGGDVLRLGRVLYVGVSSRTNAEGVAQLAGFAAPFDYRVVEVGFSGCLHLKSAVTAIADDHVLLNPAWVPPGAFPECETLLVDPAEPLAANALRVSGTIVHAAQFPRTGDRMRALGLRVESIDVSELAKAEGALTCCSLIFEARAPR